MCVWIFLWTGRWGCSSVCKQSEICHRSSGRTVGPGMVRIVHSSSSIPLIHYWHHVATLFQCPHRDGGLKRQKVKDSYKEEQQKMYSSIIVGQSDHNSSKTCDTNTEETGETGQPLWSSFLPLLPSWPLLVYLVAAPTLFHQSLIFYVFKSVFSLNT